MNRISGRELPDARHAPLLPHLLQGMLGHAAAGRSGDSHSGCVYRAGDDGPVLHCEGGAEVAFDA